MVENNLPWGRWEVARLCKRAAIVYFYFTFCSWIGQQEKWSWALSMDLLRWTLEVRPGNLKRDSGLQVITLIMLKVYQCNALACVATAAGSFTAGLWVVSAKLIPVLFVFLLTQNLEGMHQVGNCSGLRKKTYSWRKKTISWNWRLKFSWTWYTK